MKRSDKYTITFGYGDDRKTLDVYVSVNTEAIARENGYRASQNKSKRRLLLGGAVTVEVLRAGAVKEISE